ncbi:MAG: DUF1566 domain-containing protein [Candidatus Electrothrix sp. LOE2]|nr:DUF1566 domain-containing protein [Candidatus Electrothrix sp. LOE2]
MRIFFLMLYCMFSATTVHAACSSNMPASTPDSQLTDNNDGTVTDTKTGLMWKQCSEGQTFSIGSCNGSASTFTWQAALQQPGTVNDAGGFAGHTDWRLPNIKELRSIVEEQCSSPAINATRFPNTPSSYVWSGSPYAGNSVYAWYVSFDYGYSNYDFRVDNYAVRLVRGGQ